MANNTEKITYVFEADNLNFVTAAQKVTAQLESVERRFRDTSATVTQATSSISTKFKAITDAVGRLAQRMQSMRDTATSSMRPLVSLLSSVGAAFRRVSQAAESFEDGTARIPRVLGGIQGAGRGLNRGVRMLADGFSGAASSMRNMVTQSAPLQFALNNTRGLFLAITGIPLAHFFIQGVQGAVHFTETLNKFNVIMGESIDKASDFVSATAEMYGLDPQHMMDITSEFYNMVDAEGMTARAMENISLGLANMTLNLSSLMDMDISKVAQNFQSGIQGMTRALYKYGIDIRASSLEQEALNYGLKLNYETTSEANRQALRYLSIVRQTTKATGDFARTIESPANQLRIFKEQIAQVARAFGMLLVPALQTILPVLNGFAMALKTVLQFLATLVGIAVPTFGNMSEEAEGMGDAVKGVGGQVDGLSKKLKNLTAPFDELNILNAQTGGGGGAGAVDAGTLDPALQQALEEIDVQLAEVRLKANDVRDSILEFLGLNWDKEGKLTFDASQLQENLIDKFPSWEQTIRTFFSNWSGLTSGMSAVWTALGNSLKSVFTGISNGFSNMIQGFNLDERVAGWIEALPDKLQAIADWLNSNQGLFVTAGEYIAYIGVAFAGWSIISKVLGVLQGVVGVFTALGGPGLALVGIIVGIAVGFKRAWDTSEKFRGAVQELWEGLQDVFSTGVGLVQNFFETFSGTFEALGGLFDAVFTNFISPFLVNVGNVFLGVTELLLNVVNFLIETFGPTFDQVFTTITEIFTTVVEFVGGAVNSLLEILDGVITFLNGVFSGDWDKAWEGITKIFKGVVNLLITFLESGINLMIDLVNGLLRAVIGGLNSLVDAVLSTIEGLAELIGIDISIPRPGPAPQIPHLEIPRLATGGVVSSPTLSMIGEGRYPEAVVPLGNSPQMQELIEKIAEAVDNKPDDSTPIQVTMSVDGKVLYKSIQRASRARGVNFKMGAFER